MEEGEENDNETRFSHTDTDNEYDNDEDDDDEFLLDDELSDASTTHTPGFRDVLKGASHNLWCLIFIVFLEAVAYFSVMELFMLMLEEEYGMDDVTASTTYAMFGIGISIHAILFGWVVDKLKVRKSLMLQLIISLFSKLLLGLFPSHIMLWLVMMGPLSFAISIGGTVVMVGIKRYTSVDSRAVAFSINYMAMNIGDIVASPLADFIRTYFAQVLEIMNIDGYSLFVAITAFIHLVSVIIAYYGVHDMYVPEDRPFLNATAFIDRFDAVEIRQIKWNLRPVSEMAQYQPTPADDFVYMSRTAQIKQWIKQRWSDFKAKFTRALIGLSIISFGMLGAKSITKFLDSLYPLYMSRAPFPVEDPSAVPYLTILTINPILVVLFTLVVANYVASREFHPYTVIVVGITISAFSPVLMVIVEYWAVIVFIVVMTFGEIIWAPMLDSYVCWFAPQGEEGVYLALTAVPVFAAKGGAGWISGQVLNHFCPLTGGECRSAIWLFVALLASTSPIILISAYKLVKIKNPVLAKKEKDLHQQEFNETFDVDEDQVANEIEMETIEQLNGSLPDEMVMEIDLK